MVFNQIWQISILAQLLKHPYMYISRYLEIFINFAVFTIKNRNHGTTFDQRII